MSIDLVACREAKKFVEYLEAFSFANTLIGSVSSETMTVNYSAVFGEKRLSIEYSISSGKLRINVMWMPNGYLQTKNVKLVKTQYDSIKSKIKVLSCSVDQLRETMVFLLDDFGELNVLLDLLTEST